jgi:hypothetical protein
MLSALWPILVVQLDHRAAGPFLTNCQVVVVIFLGLAAVVELIESLAIEGRTAEKAAKMVVVPEIAAL